MKHNIEDLRAALERLERFTFTERWGGKGLDDEAQKVYDMVHAALHPKTVGEVLREELKTLRHLERHQD